MTKKLSIPFGEAVVRARKTRGVSQAELAKRMRRNAKQLGQIENNRSEPQLSTILLIARALQMEPGELVDDVNAHTPPLPEEPFDFSPPKVRGRPRKSEE